MYALRVNGDEPRGRRRAGSARACCTCCASGSVCPARRPGASRASAARARCSSTARWCARASCSRRRAVGTDDRHRRGPAARRARRARATCSARSSRPARCSAGSARPVLSWPCTSCSNATPSPTDLEVREAISGNLCRCTGYGRILDAVEVAAATRRGRRTMSVDVGTRRRGRDRRARDPARRRSPRCAASSRSPAISGPTACCGARRCARRTRRRASCRSTSRPRSRSPGVHAVLTADDVPVNRYGLEHRDQPVLAGDVVRYVGEPVAAVAADHPETARRACAAIVVDYEVLEPLVDPETGDRRRRRSTPTATCSATSCIRRGDPDARGPIVVEGTYEIGMQDQAFMGPEAGLAVPDRRRRRRPRRVDAVAAQRPRSGGRVPRAAARARAPLARRRRRRVRRPRGRQPAHPRLPARAATPAGR